MRRILLFLCLLSPLVAHAAAPNRLVKIVVAGSKRYSEADLTRATGLTLNSQVTADDLQNAAARLGGCGVFSFVQFTFKPAGGPNGVEADFSVKDAERFLPAIFENVVWFTDQELQSALHDALPLYNGQLPASGSLPDDLTAALAKLLASRGLPSDVSYIPKAEMGKPVSEYSYTVNNANLKIGPIHFTGATHIEANALAQSVSSLQDRDYLRGDVEVILTNNTLPLYRERGYLQAAISQITSRFSDGTVQIEVGLVEGIQFKLAGYAWSGNTLITSDELSKSITLKTGDIANAIKLDHDLNAARKLFGKFGHEGAMVSPVPTFAGDTVTYSFQVTEGDLYRMGRVEIAGLGPEVSRKLLVDWKLAEGAPYDNTYPLQFLRVVLKATAQGANPHWQWEIHEHINDATKIVDVRLEVKVH